MAQVISPSIDWTSGKAPQAESAVVDTQNILNATIVYNGGILTTPQFNQLVNPPADGYPF